MVTLLWLTPSLFPLHQALPAAAPDEIPWSYKWDAARETRRGSPSAPWHWGLPSFYWQCLSSHGILFYCFISKSTQDWWLLTRLVFIMPVCYGPSFQSAYGHHVPDLVYKVLWMIPIFMWASLCSSFLLRWPRGCFPWLSTRGFAGEILWGGSGDFVLLWPKDACHLHSPSKFAWVEWTLIFGSQGDVFLSPWVVIGAVYYHGYINNVPLPRNSDRQGCMLKNECLSGKCSFTDACFAVISLSL